MQGIENIVILDTATAVLLVVLASLSKRLGEALKIRPYYRLMHLCVGLVVIASAANAAFYSPDVSQLHSVAAVIPSALRLAAGLIAALVCLRYWRWLFAEYMKK